MKWYYASFSYLCKSDPKCSGKASCRNPLFPVSTGVLAAPMPFAHMSAIPARRAESATFAAGFAQSILQMRKIIPFFVRKMCAKLQIYLHETWKGSLCNDS